MGVILFAAVIIEFALEPLFYGQYPTTPKARIMFIVKWIGGEPLSGGEVDIYRLSYPVPPYYDVLIAPIMVHLNSSGIGVTEDELWLEGKYDFKVYNASDLLATVHREYDFRVYRPLEDFIYLSKRYSLPKVVMEEIVIAKVGYVGPLIPP